MITFPLALGVAEPHPQVIALTCLALASADHGEVVRAAPVLATTCAMKTTGVDRPPVLAIMAHRCSCAPRAAARSSATALAATVFWCC